MRFLLDNNLTPSLAHLLRELKCVVDHVSEIGYRDAADTTIIRLALEQGAIVVTQDNDFPQLLALSKADGPSVILLRPGSPIEPAEVASLLISLPTPVVEALAEGAVVSIDVRGERIRRLPLR